MRCENLEHGLVRGIDRAVLLRDADAEADLKTVAQVDIREIAPFDCQSVRLCHSEACLHHVPAQPIAKLWGQVTWGLHLDPCLRRRLGRTRLSLARALFHAVGTSVISVLVSISAFAL